MGGHAGRCRGTGTPQPRSVQWGSTIHIAQPYNLNGGSTAAESSGWSGAPGYATPRIDVTVETLLS